MSQLSFLDAEEAAIDPVEVFLPLEFWLPLSEARSLMELEPWQRFQLAWWGRCRCFDWKVRVMEDVA